MEQKDIAEKRLESYNDVFADIVNTLLFSSEKLIAEDQLEDGPTGSSYSEAEKLYLQDRDITKIWRSCGIRLALLGIENQTTQDPNMVIRAMCYDAASYHAQVRSPSPGKEKYPVVTLVLYFGTAPWQKARKLSEAIPIEDRLKPYVNDYQMNLFEVAFLSDEQISCFHSDFRAVAEYFRSVQKGTAFSAHKLKHVSEVLRLLAELTKDKRYLDILANEFLKQEGGITMCELLDRYIKQGEEKGLLQGREEGRKEGQEKGREEGLRAGIAGAIAMLRRAGCSDSKIAEELILTFHLSRDEAQAYIKAG